MMAIPRKFEAAPAERVPDDSNSPWWGEHRSRYHFAAKYVRGRRVLDIACGAGFGVQILSDAGARSVLGIDTAPEAITLAREAAPEEEVLFAELGRLPVRNGKIDLAVSFQTLEHLCDANTFVEELRRVLSADGRLILSTSNPLQAKPADGTRDPVHVQEYTPDELQSLLKGHFGTVELLGQKARPGYRVNPYWERSGDLTRDLARRAAILSWRVQNRFPFAVKDRLSRLLHNRGFYPGEYDWVFVPLASGFSHVLIAMCEP